MPQIYTIYIKETPLFIGTFDIKFEHSDFLPVNETNIFSEVKNRWDGKTSVPMFWQCKNSDEVLQKLTHTTNIFKYIEAAGGLVRNENDEYLFIYRLKRWDLPKGKLEKGEKITECALREVEEECNVKVNKIVKQLPSSFHFYEQKGEFILKQTYWFLMECIGQHNILPQTEEGIEQVRWLKKSEMQPVLDNTYPAVKECLKEISD